MTPTIIKAVTEEIVGVVRGYVDAVARGLDELRAQVRDIPAGAPGVGIKSITQAEDLRSAEIELDNGQHIVLQMPAGPQGEPGGRGEPGQGIQGEPGIGIKSITQTDDWQTLGIEFDNGETVDVKLPPGPRGFQGDAGVKGDPGTPGAAGQDGKAPSADEVAALLRASPEFVQAATPETLQAAPWKPGIHRSGTLVAHYIGRLYCAAKDTTDEPGDSPDWRRIGTGGSRHVGGYDDTRLYEPGDYYAKSGSMFLFDGANHRLIHHKPFTEADAEKAIAKAVTKITAEHRAELRTQTAALVEAQAIASKAIEEVTRLREQLQELLE
jgi:hypothetical protein